MGRRGGDFDYDAKGQGYAGQRRPDPRIEAMVHAALGDARTVLNVGAGAGSYEPLDRHVIAIEPSAAMRAQRPAHRPAIIGFAEQLPLDDQSVDAAMAMYTVHQWADAGCRRSPSCGGWRADRWWCHSPATATALRPPGGLRTTPRSCSPPRPSAHRPWATSPRGSDRTVRS